MEITADADRPAGLVNTGPVNTGLAETGPPETGPVNTGLAETGAETGPVNTGLAETGAETGLAETGAETGLAEIPGDPLALERQVCFALSVAARSVLSIYRPILEPMGLTHPQYLVMLALWGQSPLAVKELIEMLQLDGPTLSPMLKRLEAAGLVTRTRDPHDERQLRVGLTRQGRALREQALNVPPTVVAKLGMSLGDLEELHRGLTTLNAAARRAGVKPAGGPAKDSV